MTTNKEQANEESGELIFKIIVNLICWVPAIAFIIAEKYAGKGTLPSIFGLPIMIWGFFGLNWCFNAFSRLTGMVVIATFETWGWFYLIGSVIFSGLGLVIIPLLLLVQIIQLMTMEAPNNPQPAPAKAPVETNDEG
jgi:hypothetical protein